ncbi:MAG: phosphoribosylglycinamide formyltransferase [Sneathiella sp.]|nr:phosphoribosylglycinamide formyltransferase [Sneathiella sp.]
MKIAILISSRGTNMQALVKACEADGFPAEVVTVLSNNPDAAGLDFAKKHNIDTKVINHRDYEDRESFDTDVSDYLSSKKVDLICLAGFMRLLTSDFVNRWRDRIINIHPSLLPAFKGLHVHERALESGTRFTGCTVHFVRPEMDDGPIISQAVVPILAGDTADSLAARILVQEHRIYPHALKMIAEHKVKVHGSVATIEDAPQTEASLTNPFVEN